MESEYASANEIERERMDSLLDRLTDDDLVRRLPNGLTIATVLVHMSFWDEYCRARLDLWERTGFEPALASYEAMNATIIRMASVIPTRSSVELARTAAHEVDRQVEQVSPGLVAALEAAGYSRLFDRASHRRQHVDQIQEVLRQL